MPDQGEFVYHDQFPRFLARAENGELAIFRKLDGEEPDYAPKLKRAEHWFKSLKIKK